MKCKSKKYAGVLCKTRVWWQKKESLEREDYCCSTVCCAKASVLYYKTRIATSSCIVKLLQVAFLLCMQDSLKLLALALKESFPQINNSWKSLARFLKVALNALTRTYSSMCKWAILFTVFKCCFVNYLIRIFYCRLRPGYMILA